MSPDLKLVKDPRIMNMKTIPLAPIRPVLNSKLFSTPVTAAAIIIMVRILFEPYFSSRIGPISSINAKLPIR